MRSVRAFIIAVVFVANGVYALPMTKMKPEDIDRPEFRHRDIAHWYGMFGERLGMEKEVFAAQVRRLMWAQRETVMMLRTPFRYVFSSLHVSQQWGLFAIVTEAPDRLVIEVRRNGEWETLYRRLDPEDDWHDPQMKYRRSPRRVGRRAEGAQGHLQAADRLDRPHHLRRAARRRPRPGPPRQGAADAAVEGAEHRADPPRRAVPPPR